MKKCSLDIKLLQFKIHLSHHGKQYSDRGTLNNWRNYVIEIYTRDLSEPFCNEPSFQILFKGSGAALPKFFLGVFAKSKYI